MKITKRVDNRNLILKLSGTCEAEDCVLLQNALDDSSQSFCSNILIDMHDLLNITPGAQRILLSFLSRIQALHMSLVLYGVNESVVNALQDSGMANFVQIASSLKDAKNII